MHWKCYQLGHRPQVQTALLDEVVAVTHVHRKAAIRLLRHAVSRGFTRAPRRRLALHGAGARRLRQPLAWEAAGVWGAHCLHPLVPEPFDRLTAMRTATSGQTSMSCSVRRAWPSLGARSSQPLPSVRGVA